VGHTESSVSIHIGSLRTTLLDLLPWMTWFSACSSRDHDTLRSRSRDIKRSIANSCSQEQFEVRKLGLQSRWERSSFAHRADYSVRFKAGGESLQAFFRGWVESLGERVDFEACDACEVLGSNSAIVVEDGNRWA
jgi:hypothetical protein